MKTTSVYIDIFVVGALNAIWIALLVSVYGFSGDVTFLIPSNSLTHLVIAAVVVYTLGIVFDYINSWIFGLLRTADQKELFKRVSIVRITSQKPELSKVIDNHYARLRIARAIVITVIPITFLLIVFLNSPTIQLENKPGISLSLVILGMTLLFLSYFSYSKRNAEYINYIREVLLEMDSANRN